MMEGVKGRGVPQQRVGAIYLLLTLAGCGGALALAYGSRLGTVTAASAMLPSLATVYLAWASFRADRSDAAGGRSLEQAADELADAIGAQWRTEAHTRRLHDPYPLAVSWRAAPAQLVEDWSVLTSMATSWPEHRPQQRENWARHPADLCGQWEQLHDILIRRVPTGRLLVLGEPGSGKTTLLVHLLQQIAHDRTRSQTRAVPVLFTLASWNPQRDELAAWMARCLRRDYPALNHPAGTHPTSTWARTLVDHGLILPILDGLDELPAEHHRAALDAINQFLGPGQGIVLSSRTSDYHRGITERGHDKLAGAAGIELQPVPPGHAAAYLTHGCARPQRWTPLISHLGSTSPIGQALSTPQMLFLARTLYNTGPAQHAHTQPPDPAELCRSGRFPDLHSVEQHLLRSYISAAYRPTTHTGALPFSAETAERTLVFLADHLTRPAAPLPDIAWWQLPEALPRHASVLLRWAATATLASLRVTIPAGLCAALTYSLLRAAQDDTWTQTPRAMVAAAVGALTAAAVCALAATTKLATRKLPGGRGWTEGLAPLSAVRWHWDTPAITLALTSATVIVTGSAILLTGTIGVTLAAPLGVTAVIWGGMRTDTADLSTANTPSALLNNEHSTVLRNGLLLATLGAIATAALYAWRVRSAPTYTAAILTGTTAGTAVGLFAGLFGRLSELASWSFTTTRHHLAARHDLPRDLMRFLADAHQHRGVLRQIGGVYQFRHPDLQQALTTTTEHPHHRPPHDDPARGAT